MAVSPYSESMSKRSPARSLAKQKTAQLNAREYTTGKHLTYRTAASGAMEGDEAVSLGTVPRTSADARKKAEHLAMVTGTLTHGLGTWR